MAELGWSSLDAVAAALLLGWRRRCRGLFTDCGIWACVAVLAILVGQGSANEFHVWTDASGKHETEAELVGTKFDKESGSTLIILRKPDGNTVEVPSDQLSRESRSLAVRLLRNRRTTSAKPDDPKATPEPNRRTVHGARDSAIAASDSLHDVFGADPLFVQTDPIEHGVIMGLATANKEIYLLVQGYSADHDAVMKVDRRNGTLMPLCLFPASGAAAICCDERDLWVLSRSRATFLRRFSLAGQLMQTVPLRSPVPGKYYGLAIDGGTFYFSSSVESVARVYACVPTGGGLVEVLSTPGKIYSLTCNNGKLHAYLKHFDTYSDDWLLICDAPRQALDRDKPASSRKMRFFHTLAWGLASEGDKLLVLTRQGKKAEIYEAAVLENESRIVGRPIHQSVSLQIPIMNENLNRYRMNLYLACPTSHSFQQVANLSLTPGPVRPLCDVFGNTWAHFQLIGGGEPLSVTQTFDILTTSVAHTLDKDHIPSKQDVLQPALRLATSETYCFDFSNPAVAALAKSIPVKPRYLDQILAVRDAVNDALDKVGPSGPQCRASEFLSLGVGRCYAHTLLFGAVARARGIPTRAIGGVKLTIGSAGPYEIDEDSVHTWNQCHMPGLGWVDIDATRDDRKDGKHSHNYVGFRPNGHFITFVGAYDRRDMVSTFAQRGWHKTYAWSSLDKRNKAKVTLGTARVTTRKQAAE